MGINIDSTLRSIASGCSHGDHQERLEMIYSNIEEAVRAGGFCDCNVAQAPILDLNLRLLSTRTKAIHFSA